MKHNHKIAGKLKRSIVLHVFWVSLFMGILCYLFRLKGVWTQAVRQKVIIKLQKKYRKKIKLLQTEIEQSSANLPHEKSKKIWVCWMQGIKNAPPLVQACFHSLQKHLKGYEIIEITENNYASYVEMPDFIMEKYRKGCISKTHFSDLLRLELLIKYGGTWIDSTVLCTGSDIPDYMLNSDLFVFSVLYPDKFAFATSTENWFISSCTNNKILLLVKELLYIYWKRYNFVGDYLLCYDFFEIAINAFPEEWRKVVPFHRGTAMNLRFMLFEKYDADIWREIIKISPFHKLSYKFDADMAEKEGTYYRHIVDGYLTEDRTGCDDGKLVN